MVTWTQPPAAGAFLLREVGRFASRVSGVLAAGQQVLPGTVLGKVLLGGATTDATGNTGNGTITMDATNPVRKGAKVGDYKATCIAAAANGGTFRVQDPEGFVLGDVAVGETFDNGVKFAIADGGTDFIVGDKFTITVASGSGNYTALAPNAEDGSQVAAGVSFYTVYASAGAQPCVAIARDAELIADELIWPVGITSGEKSAAIQTLRTLGLLAQ
ncbi:MAG: head decoration protein [Burkholderiales bacterium]